MIVLWHIYLQEKEHRRITLCGKRGGELVNETGGRFDHVWMGLKSYAKEMSHIEQYGVFSNIFEQWGAARFCSQCQNHPDLPLHLLGTLAGEL